MNEFKIGDKVKIIRSNISSLKDHIGDMGIIDRLYGQDNYQYGMDSNTHGWHEDELALVKGKRGRPAKIKPKPTIKTLYVIYKKGCINYETTIKGPLKEAKKELKELGDDYVLFEAKPIFSCATITKTTFKKVKEMK